MLFNKSIIFFILSFPSFFTVGEDKPLFVSDSGTEVVYFFSLHCETCYEVNISLSALDLLISEGGEVTFKKIPIIQDDWMFGARLYFLIEASRSKHTLTKFEREIASYSLVANTPKGSYPKSDFEYARILRDYGMVFTPLEFNNWWDFANIMIESSKEIIRTAGIDSVKAPSARIYHNNKLEWIYASLSSKRNGVEFIKSISDVVKLK